MELVIARHRDGHLKTVRISRIRQKLLCLFHIVRIGIHHIRVEIFRKTREHIGTNQSTLAVRHHVKNLCPVDGVTHRLTHADIIKRLFGIV